MSPAKTHGQIPPALARSWSLLLAIVSLFIPLVLLSEPGRGVVALSCFGLIVHSWFVQRKYTKSREYIALWTLALSLPALASLWLGLNVLRFYFYNGDSPRTTYFIVTRLQAMIEFGAPAIAMVVTFWTVGELAAFLARRISFKVVGRRKTWWNRQFRGVWLLGSLIGFVLSALIQYRWLRWFVIVLSALGCLFALIFRLFRPEDEI